MGNCAKEEVGGVRDEERERRKKNVIFSNFGFSENKGIYITPDLKTLKLYAPSEGQPSLPTQENLQKP